MVNTFIITGNTWLYREALKHLNGRWVPHLNAWLIPEYEQELVKPLRDQSDREVRLVGLPIDIDGSSRAGREARRRAAVSNTPSPAAR